MDRRIRVKCPDCAASIELLVDLQELLDVTCPRCQHLFTAKVPPPVLEIVPVEVEPIQEEPVRRTRLVQPPREARRKRERVVPPQAPKPYDNDWFEPPPKLDEPIPLATHLKAILISAGSIVCLGLLVISGMMIKSTISNMEWSSTDDESAATEPLVSAAPITDETGNVDGQPTVPQATEPTRSPTELASTELASSGPIAATTDSSANVPSVPGKTGTSDIASKVVLLANQIADASKDADNEFILDRTHPKLIELAGGRSKMLDLLNQALEPMKRQGIKIANYSVSSNVVVRQVGQKIFVVLPTTMDLKYPNRTTRTDSFLLAVSEDAGRTYSFIDGSGAAKNRNMLKVVLPDLPDDMVLPTPSTPREVLP